MQRSDQVKTNEHLTPFGPSWVPVQAPLTGMSAVLCRNSGATAAELQDASGDCDHDIGHNEMANTAIS